MRFEYPIASRVRRQLEAQSPAHGAMIQLSIGSGDASVERTIAAMQVMARHAADHPDVHQIASTIAASAPNRNRRAQLYALDQTMRDLIHFKPDTIGREVLRHPAQILSEVRVNGTAACDCDDAATLGAAIIRAMGMRPAFRVIAPARSAPFAHVHVAALIPGTRPRLFPIDPQERVPPGTWTPAARQRVWWA